MDLPLKIVQYTASNVSHNYQLFLTTMRSTTSLDSAHGPSSTSRHCRHSYEADICGEKSGHSMWRTMRLGVRSLSFSLTPSLTIVNPAGEFYSIFNDEDGRGLYRRISLTGALLGISNDPLQERTKNEKLSASTAHWHVVNLRRVDDERRRVGVCSPATGN